MNRRVGPSQGFCWGESERAAHREATFISAIQSVEVRNNPLWNTNFSQFLLKLLLCMQGTTTVIAGFVRQIYRVYPAFTKKSPNYTRKALAFKQIKIK